MPDAYLSHGCGSGERSKNVTELLAAWSKGEEQLTAFPCQSIDHRLLRVAIEQSERKRSRCFPDYGNKELLQYLG